MSNLKLYPNFTAALDHLKTRMINESFVVHTEKWQGLAVKAKPEAQMREILFPSFQVPILTEDLDTLSSDIKPNLPWADRHFIEERVSGQPINPGETWKLWPWSNSADKFRTEGEQYNHSYAERYWPKYAGLTPGGKLSEDTTGKNDPTAGIRYAYGDLWDVINLLADQPLTRQAYLPVFFPEDTGAVHDRVSLHHARGRAPHQLPASELRLRPPHAGRHLLDGAAAPVGLGSSAREGSPHLVEGQARHVYHACVVPPLLRQRLADPEGEMKCE